MFAFAVNSIDHIEDFLNVNFTVVLEMIIMYAECIIMTVIISPVYNILIYIFYNRIKNTHNIDR